MPDCSVFSKLMNVSFGYTDGEINGSTDSSSWCSNGVPGVQI